MSNIVQDCTCLIVYLKYCTRSYNCILHYIKLKLIPSSSSYLLGRADVLGLVVRRQIRPQFPEDASHRAIVELFVLFPYETPMSLTEDQERIHRSTHGADSWLRISTALCLVHDPLCTSRYIEINDKYIHRYKCVIFHPKFMWIEPE